jgi:hypothetical protein
MIRAFLSTGATLPGAFSHLGLLKVIVNATKVADDLLGLRRCASIARSLMPDDHSA